jgi:hypothetical protein
MIPSRFSPNSTIGSDVFCEGLSFKHAAPLHRLRFGTTPCHMPWTGKLVQQRLREALACERRPPGERTTLDVLRAQEALGWLCLVEKSERRFLAAQALAADAGLSTRAMLRARGWPVTTFYRSIASAASRIANELDARGVAVR